MILNNFSKSYTISWTNDNFIEQFLIHSGFIPSTLDQLVEKGFVPSPIRPDEGDDIIPMLPEKSPPPPPSPPPRPQQSEQILKKTESPVAKKQQPTNPTQEDITKRLEEIKAGPKCEKGFIKSRGKCVLPFEKPEPEHFITFANPQSLQEQSQKIKRFTCPEGFERQGLKCVPLSQVLQSKMVSFSS